MADSMKDEPIPPSDRSRRMLFAEPDDLQQVRPLDHPVFRDHKVDGSDASASPAQ